MTEEETYFFDLYGYIVIRGALPETVSKALNENIDVRLKAELESEKTSFRSVGSVVWGGFESEIIANPAVLPYLKTMLGGKPRLDHDYIDVIKGGLGPIGATLHGGGTPHDPSQHYTFRDGKMSNGLVVVAYALKDVDPGDGGFACIPGSHKANFKLPPGWADMSEKLNPCVIATPCKAGDAVLFTEGLTHGTLPWRGKEQRRTLFMKYSPHFASYSMGYYDASLFPDVDEETKRILEAPNARYSGRGMKKSDY